MRRRAEREDASEQEAVSRSRSRTPDSARRRSEETPRYDEDGEPQNRFALVAERVAVPLGTNKNVRKQIAGKNMRYEHTDAKTREGLDKSRAKEWQKWMDFNAGVLVMDDQLTQLLKECHRQIPT